MFNLNVNADLDSLLEKQHSFLSNLIKRSGKNLSISKETLWKSKTKCIVLLGETGGGKTCFLELFFNYIERNNLNYKKFKSLINIQKERLQQSPIKNNINNFNFSLTEEPVKYSLKLKNNEKIIFIDTPGLKDTEGIHMDEKHILKIYYLLKGLELNELTPIMIFFFYNGELTKTTDIENYVYESFKIFFPKHSDIYFIATRKDDRTNLPMIKENYPLILNNPYVLSNILIERENDFKHCNNGKNMERATIIEDDVDDYNSRNKIYQTNISQGEKNFEKICSIISCGSLCNITYIDMLQNYEFYIEIKDILDEIMQIFEESNIIMNLLNNIEENKSKEDISFKKEFDKLLKKRKVLNKEEIMKIHPANRLIYCAKCYSLANYVYGGITTNNNVVDISSNVFILCEHSVTDCEYILNSLDARKLLISIHNLYNLNKTNQMNYDNLINRYNNNLNSLEIIKKENKLFKVKELIDSFQKRTMVEDFKSYIYNKLIFFEKNYKEIKLEELKKLYKKQYNYYKNIYQILYANKEKEINDIINKINFIIIKIKDENEGNKSKGKTNDKK